MNGLTPSVTIHPKFPWRYGGRMLLMCYVLWCFFHRTVRVTSVTVSQKFFVCNFPASLSR